MKGFEILVNGRKREFLPVTAKAFANFQIQWLITELPSDYIYVTGMKMRMDGSMKNPVIWQSEHFKPGDEITVRVVSSPVPRSRTRKARDNNAA
jgi:hypothetical protein